ncbi:ABC transporter substrate-binding protein [Ideonella sp. DXS22W]|uniref:ABC transporter substrate-binding protein n=1 Tax=Pseudaquabacterium inlustre TaxID=2984192 RepID=A0ABU9CI64_9BURK
MLLRHLSLRDFPLRHFPFQAPRLPRRGGPLALACAALLALHGAPAVAGTLRVASAFDPQTMDPHALALLYHSRVAFQVYDTLVSRDEQFRLEPALATEWKQLNPSTWRLTLRQGVSFHDGSPFTVDDAVFSLERAMGPGSQRSFQLTGVAAVKKIDAATIELQLKQPDAVLPDKLLYVAMMSRAWCRQHGVEKAQDFNAKQETFAVRNANGTGAFKLVSYAPDAKLELVKNPAWWGWKDAKRSGNLDGAVFLPIKSDATRLAALSSGEVDVVLDPPFQDVARLKQDAKISVRSTTDLGTQYLTFDQARNELTNGDVKDRNPFKDVRVRRAVAHAINVDLIIQKVLRGQATPTGSFFSPMVDGYDATLDKRLPYDPGKAKALLAEAGYPNGFGVTLDCVNVAWREAVCQAASAMLTQVGIRTQLRSSPTNQFFPKLSQGTASFIEFGWTPTTDPWNTLNGLVRTHDPAGGGTFNAGRYSNPQLDTLIDAVRVEPDLVKRRARVGVALRLIADEMPYLPLYRRTLNWATSKKVQLVQWPNDTLELRWVKLAP